MIPLGLIIPIIIYLSLLIMCLVVAGVQILSSLVALATAHPSCSLVYGFPNGDDCHRLLVGFTRSDPGTFARVFVPAVLEQPPNVGFTQWSVRVNIAKFWHSGKILSYSFILL